METSELIVIIVASAAAWVAICYFGLRWIFSMKRQLWNQRQMLRLLIMIAEKQGANKDDLSWIRESMNKDDEHLTKA